MKYLLMLRLGGTGPRQMIAAKTKKRALEIVREHLGSPSMTMGHLNDYCYWHQDGQWWDRFAQDGEALWIHPEPEYLSTLTSKNWERKEIG